MMTTTAIVVKNIAVLGSVHLGYSIGQEILVEQTDIGWVDRRGIVLPDECLRFDLSPQRPGD